MFAVIRTGGKQYKVAKDDTIQVEKLDTKEGATIDLDNVLYVEGGKKAKVSARVVEHIRAPKVIVFKKKRRKGYRRKLGHRQNLTVLKIVDVKAA